ncbi:ROK family transcriptional regulator [Kribbella sp. NBC_00482]|uniref:ROK family transcriptional regulator n=1 Tax=Kribbella sp. NBC_00482 TaxID=2975968 RepID=UPI002E18A1EE
MERSATVRRPAGPLVRPGSKTLIREINEALVLDVVRTEGVISRAAVAARTGLSPATVTGIVGRLVEAGYLAETDIVQGARGRPARQLQLGDGRIFAAGVRVARDHLFAVLVDLRGTVVDTQQVELPDTTPSRVGDAVARAISTLGSDREGAELLGVGVAVSGVVDSAGGLVRHSGALGWEGVALGPMIESATGLPTVVDSYVNCLAQGMLLFGREQHGRDLLVFNIGTSLGVSIVVGGRLHRGSEGAAGSFAHARATGPSEGRTCHCGAEDCVEAYSSGWGIARRLAESGTSEASVVPDAAERLGVGIANLAKVVGPAAIVLASAGEMRDLGLEQLLTTTIRTEYAHHYTPVPDLQTVAASPESVATGAAHASLARLFTADGTPV